jgi:hypothetical protein
MESWVGFSRASQPSKVNQLTDCPPRAKTYGKIWQQQQTSSGRNAKKDTGAKLKWAHEKIINLSYPSN